MRSDVRRSQSKRYQPLSLIHILDANKVEELVALIEQEKPDVVLNLALPYQDLTIMDAPINKVSVTIPIGAVSRMT